MVTKESPEKSPFSIFQVFHSAIGLLSNFQVTLPAAAPCSCTVSVMVAFSDIWTVLSANWTFFSSVPAARVSGFAGVAGVTVSDSFVVEVELSIEGALSDFCASSWLVVVRSWASADEESGVAVASDAFVSVLDFSAGTTVSVLLVIGCVSVLSCVSAAAVPCVKTATRTAADKLRTFVYNRFLYEFFIRNLLYEIWGHQK